MSSLKRRLNKIASNKEQEIIIGSDKILKVKDELDRVISYFDNNHLFIELDELNDIIKPGENSYVGAKSGGVFIGLKKEMIERAEKWLKENRYSNKIVKWETELWGEVPADFGRK
jgi:hypothetical protein